METNSRMVRQFSRHLVGYHLCLLSSGDTGVAASLVLHGTPPFHVYYHMQRDKEPARELVKTFYNSRGEMTLQPSQSGHYIYSFSHLSDANYNKVELKGPTVDQIVHPLASAVFAGSSGRDRLTINSCSENSVDVDVNLMVSIDQRVTPT
jgi:nucleoporin POM152